MTYQFIKQPLVSGLYEPEGIYLSSPFPHPQRLIQRWGEAASFYGQYHYNGTPLKGHPGVDFAVASGLALLAVDDGRVTEIGYEAGGLGRYLKLEHRWGESLYALLGEIVVEAGQRIPCGQLLARAAESESEAHVLFHFAIRIQPYNRFDGWGGFTDPLPFLEPSAVDIMDEEPVALDVLHPMVDEEPGMRRP